MNKKTIRPYLASVGLVFITTIFGEFVKRKLEPTNIVMFYLLAVVFSAIRWGQGPAIVTSILGVFCFDFFLVPPYLTLNVAHIQYIFTFIGFLIVGLVVSTLASKTREHLIQRQKEKLETALLNSISHDLRTPLVSITGSLSVLLKDYSELDDVTRKELLETAMEEAEHLNRLVGNLLDMTKMEAGALHISRKPCELRDVLGAALEQFKEKILYRDIKIDIPKDFPELPMDQKEVFQAGNLVMDITKHEVKINSNNVNLTPTEYDILKLLVLNAGKVLTHKQILKEVWDKSEDLEGVFHLLRVTISNLRSKIEPNPDRPTYVITEPCIGYRLRAED